MLKVQLKQTVCSPVFLVSCLSLYLLLILQEIQVFTNPGLIEQGLLSEYLEWYFEEKTIGGLLSDHMGGSATGSFFCIMVVLPTVWYRSKHWEGETYYTLLRSGKREYYLGNIGSAILSSMLMAGLALLLYCITLGLIGFHFGPSRWEEWYTDQALIFLAGQGWYPLITGFYILTRMMYAAVCCMESLVLSAFISDRYLLVGMPYVCVWGISLIADMNGLPLLSPSRIPLDVFEVHEGGSILYSTVYSVILCALLGLIYWRRCERRLRHG